LSNTNKICQTESQKAILNCKLF